MIFGFNLCFFMSKIRHFVVKKTAKNNNIVKYCNLTKKVGTNI